MAKLSVCILTYSSRLEYVRPVLERAVQLGFDRIYIYLNGVEESVTTWASGLETNGQITVLSSPVNLGSAGGYYKLLSYIFKHDDSDYLLMLDDDNYIGDNFIRTVNGLESNPKTLYYFDRPSKTFPRNAYKNGNPDSVLGPSSSFLGQTVYNIKPQFEVKNGDLAAAPYGGLLLPRSVYSMGLLPDTDYFLYGDDYDFTYRLVTMRGCRIKFIDASSIIDLEESFHTRGVASKFANRFMVSNSRQLFYSVRNQVVFSANYGSSLMLLYVNILAFTPVYCLQFLLRLKVKSTIIFISAVISGLYRFHRRIKNE